MADKDITRRPTGGEADRPAAPAEAYESLLPPKKGGGGFLAPVAGFGQRTPVKVDLDVARPRRCRNEDDLCVIRRWADAQLTSRWYGVDAHVECCAHLAMNRRRQIVGVRIGAILGADVRMDGDLRCRSLRNADANRCHLYAGNAAEYRPDLFQHVIQQPGERVL